MLFRSSYAVVATVAAVIGSTSSPTTNAFIFDAFNGFAGLKDLATKVETDKKLAIRLDISPSKDSSPESPGLSLAGLQLGLSTDMAGPTSQRVKLPGADGPNPKTSSGARALNVESLPYYIGLDGMEKVKLENGAWEMIWWKNSKSGALICGFDCPNAVSALCTRCRNHTFCMPGAVAKPWFLSTPIPTPFFTTGHTRRGDASLRSLVCFLSCLDAGTFGGTAEFEGRGGKIRNEVHGRKGREYSKVPV